MVGGTGHRDHVRAQLPYAATAVGAALINYTVLAAIL